VNRSELLRNNSLGLPTAGVAKKTSIGAINFFDPTSTQGRQYPAPNGSSHNDSMIVDSSGDGVVILPYDNMPVVSRQSMLTLETDSVADSVLLECQSTPSSKSLGKDFCSREQFDQLRETMVSFKLLRTSFL
jgi:hypothetical protein